MPCLVAHLQVTESWFSLPLPDATTSEQQDALRVSNLGALLRQLLPALVSQGLAGPVCSWASLQQRAALLCTERGGGGALPSCLCTGQCVPPLL